MIEQARPFDYVLRALAIPAAGGTATPDAKIDDADFEVTGISVRASLAAQLGTSVIGTPVTRIGTTANNAAAPSYNHLLARLNVNDAWLQDKAVPLDLIGASGPESDIYRVNPFIIKARSKVYAEISNSYAAIALDAYIVLHGRKISKYTN